MTTNASTARREAPLNPVGPLLRSWRTSRGKSQLALAVEAGISTRHLTTITTLGTPLDITLQELRIETFFAANARSRRVLERIVSGEVNRE